MKKIIIAFLLTAIVSTGFILAMRENSNSADVGLRLLQTIPQHGHSGPADGGVLKNSYTATTFKLSNLVVSASTSTIITFDVNLSDVLSTHSTTTNTSRIVIPKGYSLAVVQCSVNVNKSASTLSQDVIAILRNGDVVSQSFMLWPLTASSTTLTATTGTVNVLVNENDYIQCAYNNNDVSNDATLFATLSSAHGYSVTRNLFTGLFYR